VFCDYNLAIILIFADLELWLVALTLDKWWLIQQPVLPYQCNGSHRACIILEVKRTKVNVTSYENRHGHMATSGCCGHCATAAVVGLHVIWLLTFL